jgi:hypothetical protein
MWAAAGDLALQEADDREVMLEGLRGCPAGP